LAHICQTARRRGILVSLGFTEGTTASVGCLWNSNVLIDADGSILNHHRKIVPTFYEKLIWANGDGSGLRVSRTELGRIGMLICGENTNPLARYALMAEGEQVHISTYPPVWPTRPPEISGNYDLAQAIRIRAGAHAFEAKVFNIVASACVDQTLRQTIETDLGPEPLRILEQSVRGISVVLDPTGTPVGDSLGGDEGILYAAIDLARSVEPKQFHDVVGHYNRFDIFALTINRASLRPANFVNDPSTRSFRSYPSGSEYTAAGDSSRRIGDGRPELRATCGCEFSGVNHDQPTEREPVRVTPKTLRTPTTR